MQIGLLWFDDDKQRPAAEKIAQAARRYREKFGRAPTVCFVNPSEPIESERVGNVVVRTLRTVLPHHFWIGVEERVESLPEAA
ncbi:MAG: hypothetical protein M5U01_10480 [Ardenticatenaceae bacterium]|nr:hypothetical protein [Ardenticatenaceae bacterium]HBY92535.1 hypothetical protein [Chloroflexota bacterium]